MPSLPLITLPPAEDIIELRKAVESAINRLITRLNSGEVSADADMQDHRIVNLAYPAERRDAVNVEFLEKIVGDLAAQKLTRPRKIAAKPGSFKRFTARHFLQRPELRNSSAEPAIELEIALPVQANIGAGLQDSEVLKRNTEYIITYSPWSTITEPLGTADATMTVANGNYFKDGALYQIDTEQVRVDGTPTGNTVPIQRGQELSAVATHADNASVQWWAKIPKESFSPAEDGLLSVHPIIDNSERVSTRTFFGAPYNDTDIPGPTSTFTLTLADSPQILDFAADPRFGNVQLTWSELGGSTYRYQLYKTVGRPPATITFAESQLYDEFDSINIGDYLYEDTLPRPGDADPVIGTWNASGTDTFNYGVRGINVLGFSAGGDTVGPLLGDATDTNPATDVTAISAAEGPDCMEDGVTMSEVTCSWTNPSDVTNWGGVNIYMLRPGQTEANYMGGPWTVSPQKFETEPTGETVTLYFVSQNKSQELNAILSSPNTTVLLDGQSSAPNPVSNLTAQFVVDGIMLVWNENAECDLDGYEIADCGDVTPALQSDILDRNVIANVKGFPGNTRKISWTFKETLYTGSSDGTVITVTPDPGWNTNAHLVQVSGTNTGKNIQFTLTNQDVQCISNTSSTITFPASSIPTGTVDFFIRGSSGEHKFYVRAYNKSGLKSEWRPSPPAILGVSPTAPDGTQDMGIPTMWGGASGLFSGGNFGYGNGGVGIVAAAQGAYPDRQNINGITGWAAKITYVSIGGGTSTSTYNFGADTSEVNYTTAPANAFVVLNNKLPVIDLPNVGIQKVELSAVNYFGDAAFETWVDVFGTTTVTSGRYTGFRAPDLVEEVSAMASSDLNLQKAQTYLHTLGTATTTVGAPSNAREGDEVTVILKQGTGGGGQIAWNAAFIGPSQFEISGEASTHNIFVFHALSGASFILKSVLFGVK